MTSFPSYASNFEDVLLNRCFRGVERGVYIDVGAHHPTFSSVTKAFYDLGWSGINVEPGDEIELLKKARPRDVNLHCAVADFEGEADFFLHSGCTATSSLSPDISASVAARAGVISPRKVVVTTLKAICEQHAKGRHIHFLKIDAEGAESSVVQSGDWTHYRPEVVVIESTEPFTTIRRTEKWQSLLVAKDYQFAYFDGINDFWVRSESKELLERFKVPVNVLDDFVVQTPELIRLREKAAGRRIKVVYFTAVNLEKADNGGAIVCREHIREFAEIENVDLTVVTLDRGSRKEFKPPPGIRHTSIRPVGRPRPRLNPWSIWPSQRWPFMWELDWDQRRSTDRAMAELVDDIDPDVFVTDYLLSAIWAPSVYRRSRLKRITISLNREADFFRLLRHTTLDDPKVSNSRIAEWRLRRFEKRIHESSAAVVTLSQTDQPKGLRSKTRTAVISPMLAPSDERWRYRGTQRVFFVGNIAHFPNHQAIAWLCNELAPEMAKVHPEARVTIIGASSDDVPTAWRRPEIDFRGLATKSEVTDCFTTSDLFIVPIENTLTSSNQWVSSSLP